MINYLRMITNYSYWYLTRPVLRYIADVVFQCETEISELKITIERQENQLKQTHASLNSRHQDYTSVRDTKEELQKENQKLLTQLQSVEEREKRKVFY